jgi:hypothetical protein
VLPSFLRALLYATSLARAIMLSGNEFNEQMKYSKVISEAKINVHGGV